MKGQSANPKGRAPAQTEKLYLATLADRCTPERWLAIVESALVRAEAGSEHAIDWLSKYLLGKPGAISLEELGRSRPTSPRAVLEELMQHTDPAVRGNAASKLLELDQGASQMQKWLAAVEASAGLPPAIAVPEGPNKWKPEDED